ncbi:uncharacterized protein STEHIDRAFT_104162 [Stereum hirsutum FP-91666 SS1]|uniref:uncharacterized protein n=1 Tax=Stereum hirsutum (strain FP-91666) TaxID=721885 RepID=UPI0004449393|nr:uncharacterized protein STEHIDRAFT_104162 [Stereum hirsutum FP-91666 SS1]EIM81666.1 hypothetical protein STEHIDRAFT_104162 [Stereum hirsutum FP-91666 SS1]
MPCSRTGCATVIRRYSRFSRSTTMAHPLNFPRHTYFYPVGNTSPVCLTQDVAPEQSASILLLGCGDPRNILFTLYSAAEAQNKFSRTLDITCCDVEPAVLARNILLFTLIMDTEPILDGPLWSIFYDFYIDSSAMRLLVDQCRRLSETSTDIGAWHASKYGSLLRICTQQTLSELRRHWALYAGFESLPTRRKAAVERAFSTALKSKSDTYELNISSARSAGPLRLNALRLVSDHFNRFWSSGVNTQDKETLASATLLNPTFVYSITGEGFSVHYGTDAFSSFHLAPAFAHLEGSMDSPNGESAASLFNFVRGTFQDWCLSFKEVAERRTLILRFAAGDALAFCTLLHHRNLDPHAESTVYATRWKADLLELDGGDYSSGADNAAPQVFDVIETSNLTDHVGLQNILIITQPILSRTPSAVVYTETLLPASRDSINGFRELICGDITTVSVLLDLVPSSFVSKFTTLNTAQEVVSQHMHADAGQYHERMTWKVMSLSESNTSPPRSPTISFEPKALGCLLFDLYLRMFSDENMNPLMQFLSGKGDISNVVSKRIRLIHNTRATFVEFARIVKSRTTTNWAPIMNAFLDLVYADKTLLTGSNYFQDMACQLHLNGVHSVDVLKPNPLRGRVASLPGWTDTPSIVFIVFQIPRHRLKPLEDYPLEELGTPILQCETQGSNFHNAFMSIQTAFGSVTNAAKAGQEPSLIFQADDEGWNSAADLVVTFAHPAWILTIDPMSTRIRFGLRSTPATVHLTATLGFELLIFDTSISDEQHVFLSRSRFSTQRRPDTVYTIPPTMNPPVPSATNHSTVTLDGSSQKIATFTVKATIDDPREQAVLEGPAQVKVASTQISPCRIALKFGQVERVVQFPFPVDGTRTRLRIARKSHYIEATVPPAGHRTPGGFFVNNFPLVLQGVTPIPWNIHRLVLDKLPTVTINKRHEWFNPSISLMMSDYDRSVMGGGQKITQDGWKALADLKESIHSLFVRHTGIQGNGRFSMFALRDPSVGPYAVVFISDVRFDLASHTFVLNGYLLPFSRKPTVVRALEKIFSSPICSVNTAGEEVVMWRRLLPALAERCRQTWRHRATCEYIKTGKVPLSLLPLESPICSCGEGKDVEGMHKVKGWKEFAPLCTRIAISPLFAVPRAMESIQRFAEASDAISSQKRCAKCDLGGDLKVCGQCKQVSYCSPACQRQDWKKHKQQCRRA